MTDKRSFRILHKGLVLALIPPCLCLVFVLSLLYLLEQSQIEVKRQAHAAELHYHASVLGQLIFEAGSVISSYSFTRQKSFLTRYEQIIAQTRLTFKRLRELVKGEPNQLKLLDRLAYLESRTLESLDQLRVDPRETPDAVNLMRVKQLKSDVQSVTREFMNVMTVFRSSKAATADGGRLEKPVEYRNWVRAFILLAAVATLPVGLCLVFYVSRSITNRLRLVVDNAVRLAAGQPLNPPLRGNDEIAMLDSAFHQMADTVGHARAKESLLVDNALDLICCLDAANKFTEVNPACRDLLGYEPDELLGRRLVDLVSPAAIDETLEGQRRALESQKSITYETLVSRKDGRAICMLFSVYWSPESRAYFCVARDITARKAVQELLKESESRLKTIVGAMPVSLFISNADGKIEMTNITAKVMFGYEEPELVGQYLNILFSDWRDKPIGKFIEFIDRRLLGRVGELSATRRNGDKLPVQVTITGFNYLGVAKFLTIALDVTERHEIEKWKQEFIQMISHDLRTPLTAVGGTLALVSAGVYGQLSEKGMSTLSRSESDLIRLTNLVDELLDLEKFEAGKMQLERGVIDVGTIVQRSLTAVNNVAESKKIRIETRSGVVDGYADGPKLMQVIVNLLSNAIKFSPPESTITIDFEEKSDCFEVRIKDQGRGVPAQKKEMIFERFKQVESEDHHVKGGKGLGLSICKSIVEAHDGTIGVESEEGKGSVFWFRIPLPE